MAKIAVVGHVEHVTLGTAPAPPAPGEIVHLQYARFIAGGGGGLAFAQLVRSDAEVHLFSVVGNDDGAATVREALERTRARVHLAVRDAPHPRVVVLVDAEGRRTIVVTAPPLQPRATDPLPWDTLASFDAVYFTGDDPGSLVRARAARVLVATTRRAHVVREAAIVADVMIGSSSDPRENMAFSALEPPPRAQVLTAGSRPTRVVTAERTIEVSAPPAVSTPKGDYGAGDSFAGALTYFVAHGLDVAESVRRAGPFGAAILQHESPLESRATLRLDA